VWTRLKSTIIREAAELLCAPNPDKGAAPSAGGAENAGRENGGREIDGPNDRSTRRYETLCTVYFGAISCPAILMVRHFHVRHFQSTPSALQYVLQGSSSMCSKKEGAPPICVLYTVVNSVNYCQFCKVL